MSRVPPDDVEDLRRKAAESGPQMGWKEFGAAVGVGGETLRQFATKRKGTSAHPKTLVALRQYFYPAPISDLATRAKEALALIEQGHAILSEVVRRMPHDPAPIVKQTVKAVRADLLRADESERLGTAQAAPHTTAPHPEGHDG